MKKLNTMIVTLSALLCIAAPVYADSTRVVTIGADLSKEQKSVMIKYFGANTKEDKVIYVTNKDEKDRLASYVPLEQIGNHTYSCAYVLPKTTGGIQVKTANLNWVTSNMIATTLSTSGVTNCQVVAASPFPVSGTGALTGAIMAYESASGKKLDNAKTDLANKELVVTGKLANDVGQSTAIAIVNGAKMDIVENNITNNEEITKVVKKVTNEYNTAINKELEEEISDLLEKISKQKYDIEQMKKTLEQVQANVVEDTPASQEKINEVISKAEEEKAKEEKAKEEKAKKETTVPETNTPKSDSTISDTAGTSVKDEDTGNIIDHTDTSALEKLNINQPVKENNTTETVVEQKMQDKDLKEKTEEQRQNPAAVETVKDNLLKDGQGTETESQKKQEADTEKIADDKKQDQKDKENKENKEVSIYGVILKSDKEKIEINTARVIWEKKDQKAEDKNVKADFESDTKKWLLDGKTMVIFFDKDTKFLKQVSKSDKKQDAVGGQEQENNEQKPEKSAEKNTDIKAEAVKVESETIKAEDLKTGAIVTAKIRADGSKAAVEIMVLADVKENKSDIKDTDKTDTVKDVPEKDVPEKDDEQ